MWEFLHFAGFGPYLLVLVSDGFNHQHHNGIKPMIVNINNHHQPDLFTSCSLLLITDKKGKRVANTVIRKIFKVSLPEPLKTRSC